jgi:D-3-phosphoglycerate dehydrogenase / 2-oxoglutarate reductase
MIRILANDGIESDGKVMLEAAGYEVVTQKVAQEDLPTALQAYDVIIVRSATQVRKALIDACPNLKIIGRGGVGMDNIDVEYARSKGIAVINTPAASSQAVAELAMGHLFGLARFLPLSNREMATGDFKKLKNAYANGIQLRGKTLGIIGFGRIGQELARLALGMGMRVVASDPYISSAKIAIDIYGAPDATLQIHIATTTLDEVLAQADFISVHTPGGDKPLLGAAEIAKMKSGVFLINCARGGVIDEDALLAGLESNHIGAAALDTFVGEPNPRKELIHHSGISVSPHIGAATVEAQAKIGLELADKIIAHFA